MGDGLGREVFGGNVWGEVVGKDFNMERISFFDFIFYLGRGFYFFLSTALMVVFTTINYS